MRIKKFISAIEDLKDTDAEVIINGSKDFTIDKRYFLSLDPQIIIETRLNYTSRTSDSSFGA